MSSGLGTSTTPVNFGEPFEVPRCVDSDLDSNRRFEELFNRYSPRLKRFFGVLGVSAEEQPDLTQETMFRVFQTGGRFENERKFEAWLFEIARNVWKNSLRYR
jgi:DNA-directed RNA polymerase specialized sigma24 family protein